MKVEIHELKTVQPFFSQVSSGLKNFELRKNDRDYKEGDILRLVEYVDGKLTGRWCYRTITYILKDAEEYGLKKGFVILGME